MPRIDDEKMAKQITKTIRNARGLYTFARNRPRRVRARLWTALQALAAAVYVLDADYRERELDPEASPYEEAELTASWIVPSPRNHGSDGFVTAATHEEDEADATET